MVLSEDLKKLQATLQEEESKAIATLRVSADMREIQKAQGQLNLISRLRTTLIEKRTTTHATTNLEL
jgi:DNA-binding transcriptional regulator GbsR (MarR family)